MKKFIIFLSLILVIVILISYRADFVQVEISEYKLKKVSESASKNALFEIDEEAYSEGYINFDDSKIIRTVSDILEDECDEYDIYICDDTNFLRIINEDNEIEKKPISYPFKIKEVEVNAPSVFVETRINKEFYSLTEFKGIKRDIKRLSGYEMKGY